jgi:hypothetical protein
MNLYVDLYKLSDVSADEIRTALINNLKSVGLSYEFIHKNLVAVICDSTAVIMRENSI